MKKIILALLVLSMAVGAVFDQTYVQQVGRSGGSSISKTMDVSILAGQLSADAFVNMEAYCSNSTGIMCSVDPASKIIVINQTFTPGIYYSFASDYGIPYATYTLTVSRVPTFSDTLQNILVAVGESSPTQQTAASLDLADKAANAQMIQPLRQLNVSLEYTIVMPSDIISASAGNVTGVVEGSTATFNLVDMLAEGQPIKVVSREVNYSYLTAILGVVLLIVLAYLFLTSSKPRTRPETPKKGRIKK